MKHEQWMKVFEDCNFDVVVYQSDKSFMSTLYLLRCRPTNPVDHAFIDVNDVEEFSWIEPLQQAIEDRLSKPDSHTIWLMDTQVIK
jgi:hypothetical protein